MSETAQPETKAVATEAGATAAPAAKPATAATKPAAEAAKPAPAAKPAAPKPGEASPNAPRPGVIYGDIRPLPTPDIVVDHQHVATAGETLATIAQIFYGDRSKASVLQTANPGFAGTALKPGDIVKIPKG